MQKKITCWRCETEFDADAPFCPTCRLLRTWADSTAYRTGHYDGFSAAERDFPKRKFFASLISIREKEATKPTDPDGFYLEGYQRGYSEAVEKQLDELLANLPAE